MPVRSLIIAAALSSLAPVAAQAQSWAPAPYPQNTVRFPGWDPRLGSLEGYRAALMEAVDRHIAAISAGYAGAYPGAPPFYGAVVDGVVVTAPPRPRTFEDQIRTLPAASSERGAVSGGVGVTPGPVPSANRTAR